MSSPHASPPAGGTSGPTPPSGSGGAGGSGSGRPSGSPGGQAGKAGSGQGGSDAGAKAGRSAGQGSLRASQRDDAWRHFRGDRVEGDRVTFQVGGYRVVLYRVAESMVESTRHAFRRPPRWDDIQAGAWRQRRSVVLRGPGGAGKTSAALRLLIGAGVSAVYQLRSVADLDHLTKANLQKLDSGPGLLLEQPRDLEELHGPLLDSLEGLLHDADAHLALIAGPEAELGGGLGTYVQRIAPPQDLRAVVDAHLDHRLGEEEADSVRAADGIGALITELLNDAAACRDAARLAEVLAHEQSGGELDPDRIRSRMDRTGGESPEEWFEELGDTGLRTQAIALAVLGGLPQEDVAWGAAALLERFRSERGVLTASVTKGPVPLSHDPFAQSSRLLAEKLRSRTYSKTIWGAFGRVPCTVAEYRDREYPARIIRHVWSEYRIQHELIPWLQDLVDLDSPQIHWYAGIALGVIGTEAFDHIATHVLLPWAEDEDVSRGGQRREAVANALWVCAQDPALRPGVRALVDSWYLSGKWPLQAAAARAYGVCLGGADLGVAVAALVRLGLLYDPRIFAAIGDAFADLLIEDVQAHARLVLRSVAEMVHEPMSRDCGHYVFVTLANTLLSEEPAPTRPTLLRLARTDPPGGELRRLLGYLWAEAIAGEEYGEYAAAVLEGWAAQAENDPLFLDDLARMLVQDVAAHSPRAARLLQRLVARWNERDYIRPLPRCAGFLGSALQAGPARSPSQAGGAL
ncbi:hypothetical protein [Streptomyces fulvoviolaceus]|uniref:hypothetical protein n=1 Tax=Streptomyces fulvoviolaceus TaxID=285535 RepID=UPI0021C0230C|nr:hypothetical protein [Streptomyces fulvoviolaceus]MCT9080113.1 hypothetical protein [Streptomyces fulvoviolaceus]